MAFPAVNLLDSFKRANEKPLSNGTKWVLLFERKDTGEVLTEKWSPSITNESEGAYWKVQEYIEPAVAVKLESGTGALVTRRLTLFACLSNPGTTEISGYSVQIVSTATAGTVSWVINKITKNVTTEIAKVENLAGTALGDLIGLQVSKGKVIAWHKKAAEAWVEVVSATDATYTAGFIGFGANGEIWKINNIEVGQTPIQILTAKLTFLGKLQKTIHQTTEVRAKLTFAGVPTRNVVRGLIAKLSFIGVLTRKIIRTLEAQLSFTGVLKKAFSIAKKLIASLSPAIAQKIYNPIYNPSFEYDVVGGAPAAWEQSLESYTNEAFLVSEAWSASGKKSLHVKGKHAASTAEGNLEARITKASRIPVKPETIWSVRARLEIIQLATNGFGITFYWYKADNTTLVSAEIMFGGRVFNSETGEKVILGQSLAAPAEAAFLNIGIRCTSHVSEVLSEYYIDEVIAQEGASISTYHDGDSPEWYWTGTPGASISAQVLYNIQRNTLKGLAAQLSFVGTLSRTVVNTLKAKLSFVGALPSKITHVLTASFSFAGIVTQKVAHQLPSALSFFGALPIKFNLVKVLVASLTFLGNLPRNINHTVAASLSFAGNSLRVIVKVISGALSFAGTLPLRITHVLTASLTFAGTLVRIITHALQANISFIGTLRKSFEITKHLQAALTFTGTLQRGVTHALLGVLSFLGSLRQSTIKNFQAALSFVGILQRRIARVLTALLTFSTTLLDHTIYPLKAALSFVGTLPKRFALIKRIAATLTFAGTIRRSIAHKLTGALSFLGTLISQTTKNFVASLAFTGTLQRYMSFIQSAALLFSGALGREITHRISATLTFIGSIQRRILLTFTSTLSFAGSIRRSTLHGLSATLTFAGALKRNVVHMLTANLAFVGLIKRAEEYIQRLSASLSFVGTLPRSIRRTLAASVAFSASLGRSIVYRLEGALGMVGALQRAILHQLIAALGVSGKMSIKIYYQLLASITFTGTVVRSVAYQLRATLTSVGKLVPNVFFVRVLVASLSFSGKIARRGIVRALQGALDFIGSIAEISKKAPQPLTDAIILKQEHAPSITLRHNKKGEAYGFINHLEGYPEMEFIPVIAKRRVFGRKD
jgi:hypothetical protein